MRPATISQLAERIDEVRKEIAVVNDAVNSMKRWLVGAVTSIGLAITIALIMKAI